MVKESYIMQMEMCMKVNGVKIKLMVMENIFIKMAQFMKELGNMIRSMDLELNNGMTVHIMREILKMGVKRAKVSYILQMDLHMKDSSVKMKLMGMGHINGVMVKCIQANGLITECMEKDI
jgi:hypothetical protein